MPPSKAPARKSPPRQASILGVHPLLAALAAMILVLAGAVGGAWLNLSDRPQKTTAARKSAPPVAFKPHTAPDVRVPPRVANLDEIEAELAAEASDPMVGTALTAKPAMDRNAAPPSPQVAPPPRDDDPVTAFAAPYDGPASGPIIAIVIDDMGLDRTRAQKVVDLPAPLTLSFMTYADDLPGWVAKARRAGHEVMGHVPMEPRDPKEKPGPGPLTVAMTPSDVADRLAAVLDPWTGYVGINNHMGSKFTADKARMGIVMAGLKARGLLWLDSKTAGDSVGAAMARAAGVPALERDIFIDNIQTDIEIRQELARAEAIARERGSAIAIGHPHDVTIAALRTWIADVRARGIALAPVTEVARRQGQLVLSQ